MERGFLLRPGARLYDSPIIDTPPRASSDTLGTLGILSGMTAGIITSTTLAETQDIKIQELEDRLANVEKERDQLKEDVATMRKEFQEVKNMIIFHPDNQEMMKERKEQFEEHVKQQETIDQNT